MMQNGRIKESALSDASSAATRREVEDGVACRWDGLHRAGPLG